jgi:hypothetical protein
VGGVSDVSLNGAQTYSLSNGVPQAAVVFPHHGDKESSELILKFIKFLYFIYIL